MAHTLYLSQPANSKSGTLKDEFEVMSKMRGKRHEALNYPDMPNIFRPIYMTYGDLNGVEMSFQELRAYSSMTGKTLDLFDIELMKDIDHIKRFISHGMNPTKILEAFNYG